MNIRDVPDDFPRDVAVSAVSGVSPKLCVRLSKGRYRDDLSDEDRHERWLICEDLAKQLVAKARNDANAHPAHSPEQTLSRIRAAVGKKQWVTPRELDWLILRLQTLLSW
ncbi:hypothetical protein [Paraburkholderia bannensis]|uniref:hypothetical protein n=1 Tax=Paraburkholderia bannensis TaxID=765414 RepID=UPI002AB77E4B|nr:hypothetical protein [Paraburkholderia bannensis]